MPAGVPLPRRMRGKQSPSLAPPGRMWISVPWSPSYLGPGALEHKALTTKGNKISFG